MSLLPPIILIVASGNTEYEALPLLLRDVLNDVGRHVDIRFPPNHRNLDATMAARLIKSGYWSVFPRPQAAIVLVDCDARPRLEVVNEVTTALMPLIADLETRGLEVLVATAKWHLEAWFFGDPSGLREVLDRDLGDVVLANPDSIENPKRHLINLLRTIDRLYTARVAGDIARSLNPTIILAASRSFSEFDAAVRRGAR